MIFLLTSLYRSLCFNISKNHTFIPTGLPDWATGKLPSEQDLEGYCPAFRRVDLGPGSHLSHSWVPNNDSENDYRSV